MVLNEPCTHDGNVPPPVPLTERIQALLRGVLDGPAGDHSLEATAAGVSVRRLNRLFAHHAGTTPARDDDGVCAAAAAAEQLLRRSWAPLAAVAGGAGFRSVETMRRAFRRAGDVTPGAYRDRTKLSGRPRWLGPLHAAHWGE